MIDQDDPSHSDHATNATVTNATTTTTTSADIPSSSSSSASSSPIKTTNQGVISTQKSISMIINDIQSSIRILFQWTIVIFIFGFQIYLVLLCHYMAMTGGFFFWKKNLK